MTAYLQIQVNILGKKQGILTGKAFKFNTALSVIFFFKFNYGFYFLVMFLGLVH